jgi:predicted nucleic acid-binding protein
VGHYYLESSALVKRYVAESGTIWVQSLCAANAEHVLYTVRLSAAEIIAALFRRIRTGTLAASDAQAAAAQFKDDLRKHYQIVEVTEPIIDRAMTLAERHGLRGYDSVQLAAAVEVQAIRSSLSLESLVFVCADETLNQAAATEGLSALNPNLYS